MLPSFTLRSKDYKGREWFRLLDELEKSEYLNIKYPSENYMNCVRHRRVSHMNAHLLRAINSSDMYLKTHGKRTLVLEGDKGKISG